MAIRKPLVIITGQVQELPAGDTVSTTSDTSTLPTSQNLAAGDYVNLYDNGGTLTARLADNSNGRPAHGFVNAATTSPANAIVIFEGANANRTGLTPGARQYLGTAGQSTETPVTTGTHQFLGVAVSATSINTDISEEITYA